MLRCSFCVRLTAPFIFLSDLPQTFCACAPIVLHMYKKYEANWTNIKGGYHSYTKAAPPQSWSDLTLALRKICRVIFLHLGRSSFTLYCARWRYSESCGGAAQRGEVLKHQAPNQACMRGKRNRGFEVTDRSYPSLKGGLSFSAAACSIWD